MSDFTPKSDFLATLIERGYVHQASDFAGLDSLAARGEIVAYVGYDCTAPSLHIGHLISIMMLSWLQRTGNKPIPLMGGGTTRVGDPSGKDETRKILTIEQIDANKEEIKKTFSSFLTFGAGQSDAVMVDNAEWLAPLNYITFLRDVGRHFSVNRMLSMDSVKLRLERESELSFIEFNYMLLQSYDFVELAKRYGCNLQMGGSDQWGNIVSGVDLVRRVDQKAAFGLTTPLLTTASGGKMGKTAQGAIWLNSDQLSPYDYWQFWRNADDADVGKFLKLFTDLPLDEITRLEALEGAEINDAKKALADAATTMLHGGGEARKARATSEKAFELGLATADLPTRQLLWVGTTEEQERNEGKAFDRRSAEALLKASELSPSLGQARKKIQNEGVWINDELVRDPSRTFGRNEADAVVTAFRIRLGKHGRIVLVKPV